MHFFNVEKPIMATGVNNQTAKNVSLGQLAEPSKSATLSFAWRVVPTTRSMDELSSNMSASDRKLNLKKSLCTECKNFFITEKVSFYKKSYRYNEINI